MLEQTERLIDEQMAIYGQHAAEHWKDEHKAAMACLDLEHLLATGVYLYQRINAADEAWRNMVYAGQMDYDADRKQGIEQIYRDWLDFSANILGRLAELEKQFEVKGASEFRCCFREVQGILTPDSDFFSDDALIELRDQAITEHRLGETMELLEP